MDPLTGAAIASGTQLGSTLLQGMFSARQAKSQMRFQRDMYKQRYQFQVEDLKKAGLNPMLAYQQAAPAAPAGAMGQMDAPDLVSSARAGYLMAQELKAMKAETYQKQTQGGKNVSDAHLSRQATETQKQITQKETSAARTAALDEAAYRDLSNQASRLAGRRIDLGPQAVKQLIDAAKLGTEALKAAASAFQLPFDVVNKLFGGKK